MKGFSLFVFSSNNVHPYCREIDDGSRKLTWYLFYTYWVDFQPFHHQIWAKKDDVPLHGHCRGLHLGLCLRPVLYCLSHSQVSKIFSLSHSQVSEIFSSHFFFAILDCRVFCGIGTLGTFVTMCILAVEITGPRWVISVWNNRMKKKNRDRKSKTVSSHKSLVGNLVHLLWAPGQVDIFSSTPSMLRFPNSDVACSSGVHDPRLASTPNCRRCPGLCRSSSLPNHSWISKVFFPSLPNGHLNQFSTCSPRWWYSFLEKVITTDAHPGGWRLLERSQSRAQFYTR